ncbi:MAG TPA: anti-sigma factor [Caldimonas sp.]|nr:anti-sigma factor [Caldimonas sp.]
MSSAPITEADLHAWIDGQLGAERAREIEAYLAERPEEAARLESYRARSRELHALFDPVLDEPLPARLRAAARGTRPAPIWRAAAAVALVLAGAVAGWLARSGVDSGGLGWRVAAGGRGTHDAAAFAHRAAIAYAVYSPDQRRAVEVSAEHEDQLVTWLTRRMGAPLKAPHLQGIGYTLEGGRLLPGGQGPVAQFMYREANGARLTLYVSNEPALAASRDANAPPAGAAAFEFSREGAVNVLTWAEGGFAYAVAATASRDELTRVSAEVYAQLSPSR